MQIIEQIRLHAQFSPRKAAFILPDRTITYEMLWSGVEAVRLQLRKIALPMDAAVGIVVDNPARHLIILLALMREGYASASLRTDQIAIAQAHGVSTLITDARLAIFGGVRAVWADDSWFAPMSGQTLLVPAIMPNRVARIALTSGSTGRPKAIGYTFHALNSVILSRYLTGIGASERFLLLSGLSGSALFYIGRVLLTGGTTVFCPLERALATISHLRIDEVRGSASQARAMLEQQRMSGVPVRLKLLSTGGGPLSPALARDLATTFRADIINTYSSTECPQMGLATGALLDLRESLGNCFALTAEVGIVDDHGAPVPAGVEGRVRARSEAMGWPYDGCLTQTPDVMGDGWFYPGDVGRIDESGLLIIVGRGDDLINSGGAKFSPERIEEALAGFPSVTEIAVAGVKNEAGEVEIRAAAVCAHPLSANQLNGWIERNLSGELGSIELARVVSVDRLPRTDSGKISRAELRAILEGP